MQRADTWIQLLTKQNSSLKPNSISMGTKCGLHGSPLQGLENLKTNE